MRLRALLLTALPLFALIVSCGGDDSPGDTADVDEPVVSATPYPVTPTPIIVSGPGSTPGNSSNGTEEATHTVVSGDTLIALADRYDTTVEAIMRRNNLSSASDLTIGQQLIIPSSASSVATPPSSGPRATATARPGGSGQGQTYEVQSGDLAGSIASRFGITLEELAQANNRTVESLDQLQVGEELVIPAP